MNGTGLLGVVIVIVLATLWLTRCIDQVGNLILKRLDELETRIDGTE